MLQPRFAYKLHVNSRNLRATVSFTTPLGSSLPGKLERYVVMLFYLRVQIARNVPSKRRHVIHESQGEMPRVAPSIALLNILTQGLPHPPIFPLLRENATLPTRYQATTCDYRVRAR